MILEYECSSGILKLFARFLNGFQDWIQLLPGILKWVSNFFNPFKKTGGLDWAVHKNLPESG